MSADTSTAPPKSLHDLSDFWEDQKRRQGLQKKYQVWAGSGRPLVFLGSTDDKTEAMLLCRAAMRTAWVLPAVPPSAVRQPEKPGAKKGRQAENPAKAPRLFYYFKVIFRTDERGKVSIRQERGEWAPAPEPPKGFTDTLARVEALRTAEDGAKVRTIGMSAAVAQKLVAMLADGRVYWGKRSAKVKPATVRLERDGCDLVIRHAGRA